MNLIKKIFNKFFLLKFFFTIIVFTKLVLANNTNLPLVVLFVFNGIEKKSGHSNSFFPKTSEYNLRRRAFSRIKPSA